MHRYRCRSAQHATTGSDTFPTASETCPTGNQDSPGKSAPESLSQRHWDETADVSRKLGIRIWTGDVIVESVNSERCSTRAGSAACVGPTLTIDVDDISTIRTSPEFKRVHLHS